MISLLFIGTTVGIAAVLLLVFLRQFSLKPSLIGLIVFPLFAFTTGFSLRLSGFQPWIDLGFFFTDFAFLFVYMVFAIAFLLGQVRYWKV